jgi:hypothetical protein
MPVGTLLIREFDNGSALQRNCIRAFTAAFAAILIFFVLVPRAAAQEHWPAGAVGKLEGDDISVEGGAYPLTVPGATSLFVSSGGVITVHAGAARLTLPTGSLVDICGPAKFTVLESGGSFTLALNFGRVRLRLTDPTPVRVYTPFIIATPISISNEPRDFTIGLDVNDLMCVYAAFGAGRLEPQFGGSDALVAQLGEFLLPGEKLPPASAEEGSCRCTSYQPPMAAVRHVPPPPETLSLTPNSDKTSPPAEARAPQPAPAHEAAAATQPAPAKSEPEKPAVADNLPAYPADANEEPPIVPPADHATPDPPPVQAPIWKVIMPPLSFSAASPALPRDTKPLYALAIPDTHVSRDWVFSGHVEETAARPAKQTASSAPSSTPAPRHKKKAGLWGKLKRFFGSEPPPAPSKPEAAADSGN